MHRRLLLSLVAFALIRGSAAAEPAQGFPASLVFRGRTLYVTNLSLSDGGVNSKLSALGVPFPGLPLRP
jgi:hypothetical protein